MVFIVPLLIMATSLVSKINTRVALLKGWVNSFLAFMGQLYIGFYSSQLLGITDEQPGRGSGREVIGSCWWRKDDLLWIVAKRLEKACYDAYSSTKADVARISSYSWFTS